MLNKKSLIFLFLTLHLTLSLKSTDFCIKQQECKKIIKKNQILLAKCSSIKCNGKLKHECFSDICTKNEIECKKLIQADSFMKSMNTLKIYIPKFADRHSKITNKIKFFKKDIKKCENNIYKFGPNNFCINGQNCIEIIKDMKGFGFNYRKLTTTKKIDCKCPNKQSFKCGKYCASDSLACEYYKANKNEIQLSHINDCGNHNITTYKHVNYF